MTDHEMHLLLKIANDLHTLGLENYDWCKQNTKMRDYDELFMKSGLCTAYIDAAARILTFIKVAGGNENEKPESNHEKS